jgi:hypothetical protein
MLHDIVRQAKKSGRWRISDGRPSCAHTEPLAELIQRIPSLENLASLANGYRLFTTETGRFIIS